MTLHPHIEYIPTVRYKNNNSNWEDTLEGVVEDVNQKLNSGDWKREKQDGSNTSIDIDWGGAVSGRNVDLEKTSSADAIVDEAYNNSEVQDAIDDSSAAIVIDTPDVGPGGQAKKIGSMGTDDALAVTFKRGDNRMTITHEVGHLAGAAHNHCRHKGIPILDNAESIMHNPNKSHTNCNGNNPNKNVWVRWSNCEELAIGDYMERYL
jgi:hypothetical protein